MVLTERVTRSKSKSSNSQRTNSIETDKIDRVRSSSKNLPNRNVYKLIFSI
jgi:hypothetical protein